MAYVKLNTLLLIIFLWDAADASYCYNYFDSSLGYYTYYCDYYNYYLPVAWIVGGVLGFLFFLAGLIAVIVFCCCIRGRRPATAGTVIHTPANNMTFISTNAGGYINTAAYPPGIQASYPQYTYSQQTAAPPPQQNPPPSGNQPPPTSELE
uniref:Cysteine and tyrosine-rich protein 1-like n=1 Tax=Crassostrea virginica TaxID=6565 RepID=A0A8B8B136_CRAVI|nr:cysteine and tyrosine-rich protein 1-like [Crassostrea virginica]